MKEEESVDDEQESRPTVPVKREDAVALPMEGQPEDEHVESYLMLVRLTHITDPTIHRLLCVPSILTFDRFHSVLQKAFAPNPVMDGLPVEIFTLATPDPDWEYEMVGDNRDEGEYTLADIYDNDAYRGKVKVEYEYDFGDGWEHAIHFLGKADPAMKRVMRVPEHVQVFCISGELKEAFKKRGDPEGKKMWYKRICCNGDRRGLDPYKFDVNELNDKLAGEGLVRFF
ncbi:hypothetical protein SLS58_006029 [Diplodia intermedia]|uniref:Plasmid pRiA4b Orf3-like domain-containing protein n=1 Tax=Diplodia intermedia TaxID=856260 RepID=A0ABR3TP54_9PEZI